MTNRRPQLRAVPTPEQRRDRTLQRDVSTVVQRHLQEACDRAWTELGKRFGGPAMLSAPSTSTARAASLELVGLVTGGVTRLAMAALIQPTRRRTRGRRWSGEPPKLTAIQGGLRREPGVPR
jgi:hypothetical protein